MHFQPICTFLRNGNIVQKEVGGRSVEDFIGISKAAMDSDKQYYTLLEKYEHGKLDTGFMKNLARSVKSMGDMELAGKIANDYINRQSEKDLYKPDNYLVNVRIYFNITGQGIFHLQGLRGQRSISRLTKLV